MNGQATIDSAAPSEDPQPVLLQTQNLGRHYTDGDVNALVDVNLTIHQGEYVAIMGPSGSGKSTLLSLLGALDEPTTGDVLFEGRSVSSWGNLNELRAQKIGFIFQSFHLIPTLTSLENVQIPMFGVIASGAERDAKARELLAAVDMSERASHQPQQLSVGQRQRVAIARSLANSPSILLADEPTGNLDSKTASEVLDLFAELHQERKMTLVVITHSDEVAQRADRTICIRDGAIASDTMNR